MLRSIPSIRAVGCLLAAAALLALGGCVRNTVVLDQPGLRVMHTEGAFGGEGAEPGAATLTADQVHASLGRIVVRFQTLLLGRSEPRPLLPESLQAELAPVLAERLPHLAEGEWLRVLCTVPGHAGPVEVDMDVYPREGRLVYRFSVLGRPDTPEAADTAFLEPQPGQTKDSHQYGVVLRDPVGDDALAIAQARQAQQARVDEAVEGGTLDEEAAERLRQRIAQDPPLATAAVARYLEAWDTARRARQDGLISADQHQERLATLWQELEASATEGGGG